MCGICGFAGKGGERDIQRMAAAMTHRGPDSRGIWFDPAKAVYLGHRRLSIIDIAGGTQPMWTQDGTIGVVCNGEIYNHMDLREMLLQRGHIFQTDHSDTEVLLHGFREWGTDLPDRLNGMWAFVIYDRKRNTFFLSRDRFGKKPLYYTLQNQTFAFASEVSALIRHPCIEVSVSSRSLKKYFAYGYIPSPSSLYDRIYKLPGGHNLLFHINDFSMRMSQYWDFVIEPFESVPRHPEKVWGEKIRNLLQEAVKRRLMSDVPLGVFLSGGIDSSSITAFAVKNSEGEKIKTFSIGFTEKSFDESRYAQTVADLFQTEHHQESFSLETSKNLLPEIIRRLDEPLGDSSILPTYLLSQKTRKHVTVALGGDGGDELFAGYDPFQALKMADVYRRLVPGAVHQGILMLISRLPVSHRNISFDFKLKRFFRGLSYPSKLWNPIWLGPLEPPELEDLFDEPVDIEDIYSEAIEQWDLCKQQNLVDKTLQFYTKLYLQDDILFKVDRASMMNSLEVRSPYLDHALVEFVRKIPHQYKFRNGQTKYILKKALEPILPHNILYRPKKGFGVPVGRWFRKGALDLSLEDMPFGINPAFARKKIEEHKANYQDHRLYLWSHWILSQKHRLPIPNTPLASNVS